MPRFRKLLSYILIISFVLTPFQSIEAKEIETYEITSSCKNCIENRPDLLFSNTSDEQMISNFYDFSRKIQDESIVDSIEHLLETNMSATPNDTQESISGDILDDTQENILDDASDDTQESTLDDTSDDTQESISDEISNDSQEILTDDISEDNYDDDSNEFLDSSLDNINEESIPITENQETFNIVTSLYNCSSNYSLQEFLDFKVNSIRYQIVLESIKYIGNPYVYGGTSLTSGTDCSGFTQSLYNIFNIHIPRTAHEQYIQSDSIEYDELKPGDLVFFGTQEHITHVAMYLGDNYIIHASSSDVGIIVSNINYRKAYGYGTFISDDDLLKIEDGFYVSSVNANYYNEIRASSYTIGRGNSSNIGMGLCCDHSADTAATNSPLQQANNPAELQGYGYSQEVQFYMAIICSLAPYAHEGSMNNGYLNWSDFGCSSSSEANALCALACSFLCGRDYGGVSQTINLANWVKNNASTYWDFWGYIQNTSISNSSQSDIQTIVSQTGTAYYMSKPMQLTGNRSGSKFMISNPSVSMKAVVSSSTNLTSIKSCFINKNNTSGYTYYDNAKNASIDANEYITLFYPVTVSNQEVTALVTPTKSGHVYRLNYYFPAGKYQPVVMYDGLTTNKILIISLKAVGTKTLKLNKVSSNIKLVEGNSNYSLKGARYTIYDDQGNIAKYYINSQGDMADAVNLSTNSKGNLAIRYDGAESNDIKLLPGIYYIKETEASPGYKMDFCHNLILPEHKIDLINNQSEVVECNEPPVFETLDLKIYKKIKEPINSSEEYDLSNTIFKINYYNKIFDSYNDINTKPTRTWYIKTIKSSSGSFLATLSKSHLCSEFENSPLYTDTNGNVVLPLGCITIQEYQAPSGYYSVDCHGSYTDGTNSCNDVTDLKDACYFGKIEFNPDEKDGATLYTCSTNNPNIHNSQNGVTSITYRDRSLTTIHTEAFVDENGYNISPESGIATCYDKIHMEGLAVGVEYTISSTLIDLDTNETITDMNGELCSRIETFIPKESSEFHNVYIGKLSSESMHGRRVLVKEILKWDNKIAASEIDINNTDQTLYFPELNTNVITNNQSNVLPAMGIVNFSDKVTYKALKPGEKYSVIATLVYSDDNGILQELKYKSGESYQVKQDFTANSTNGFIQVDFNINNTDFDLKGKRITVFEELYYKDNYICGHKDIRDENQTIYFPDIKTSLNDKQTNSSILSIENKNVQLIDTVQYYNLDINEEYELKGKLVNKITKQPIYDNEEKEVTTSCKFIPHKRKGEIALSYNFQLSDSDLINLNIDNYIIVCFENLYRTSDGVQLVQHEDFNDMNQTVNSIAIKTNATDSVSNSHIVDAKNSVKIIDTVSYKGLIPGKKYVLKGTLMLNSNENDLDTSLYDFNDGIEDQNGILCYPLLMNGNIVEGITEFIPETKDGIAKVEFTFSALKLENHKVTVFESLYYDNILISTHSNINDTDQTIEISKRKGTLSIKTDHIFESDGNGTGFTSTITSESAKTGDMFRIIFILLCITMVSILYLRKIKNYNNIICNKINNSINRKMMYLLIISGFMLFSCYSNAYAAPNFIYNKDNDKYEVFLQYQTKNPEEKHNFQNKYKGYQFVSASYRIVDKKYEKIESTKEIQYNNLSSKDESNINKEIQNNNLVYMLKEVQWSEKPIKEDVSYIINYGYCSYEPDHENHFHYNYISEITNQEVQVDLPLKNIEVSSPSCQEGFKATLTFNNIEGNEFELGDHTIKYSENMNLTEQDYTELVRLLGYDTKLYQFNSFKWKNDVYVGTNGDLCRDATLTGQQFVSEYKAIYEDTVQIGSEFVANAIYTNESLDYKNPVYTILATGIYEPVNSNIANNVEINESSNLSGAKQDIIINSQNSTQNENEENISAGIIADEFNEYNNSMNENELDELNRKANNKNKLSRILNLSNIISTISFFVLLFVLGIILFKNYQYRKKSNESINDKNTNQEL